MRYWSEPSQHEFRFKENRLAVRIANAGFGYVFDLVVNGRSASSGEPVGPLPSQPPVDVWDRAGDVGMLAGVIATPYTLLVTFLFGRFAPEWGPRWFAANDLVLSSGVLPAMIGCGAYMLSAVRRGASLASRLTAGGIAALALWTATVIVAAVPNYVAEVIGPMETRRVEVVSGDHKAGEAPGITTADGERFQWVWAFGVYSYPRVTAGRWEITLTPNRHRIVAIAPAKGD